MVNVQIFQPVLTIISVQSDREKQHAQIEARRSGFVAFLLHLMGMGNMESLSMSPAGFRKLKSSFSGESKVYCPRAHVSCSLYTMSKAVELLFLAFFCIPPTLAMLANEHTRVASLGLLALAGVLLLAYFLSKKRVTLGIVTDAGTAETLRMKANAQELEELQDVLAVIEDLIGAESTERSTPGKTRKASSAGGPEIISCPHCQSQIQISAAHRGNQLRCPSCKQAFQA